MASQKPVIEFEEDRAPRAWIESVPLAEIQTDPRLHPRENPDPSKVAEYADWMSAGDKFPPITVVLHERRYLLVDGHYRFEAAKLRGAATIECEVHWGDLRTAVLMSARANATHGSKRSRADTRKAILKLLTDPEWSKWSDREIAKRCHCSHPTVAQARFELEQRTGKSSSDQQRQYMSRHGAVATMRITQLRSQKADNVERASISRTDRGARVVSLEAMTRDFRGEFVSGLRSLEELTARLPTVSLVRCDPSSDHMLAGRLDTLSKALTNYAAALRRPPGVIIDC